MWNVWSKPECERIFSDTCHEHIWHKWLTMWEKYGTTAAVAPFYAAIDSDLQEALRNASTEYYNG